MTTAHEILSAAQAHMKDRAVTYDKLQGERSMGATVSAFSAVTGHDLTEEQGWIFMALLKAVRSQQGAYRSDSYEDGAAYFALAGEAAARDRGKPIIHELYLDGCRPRSIAGAAFKGPILHGHELDTDFDSEHRMNQIGPNGNDGGHYPEALQEAPEVATEEAPKAAPPEPPQWIRNTGSKPDGIDGDCMVEVVWWNGAKVTRNSIDNYEWELNGGFADILFYRVLGSE